jgi:Uma2 family endonuclease
MAVPAERLYTPEEYLDLERRAETKSEYYGGRIYAMAGASRAHGRITLNVGSALNEQFLDRACEAFTSDMRVKVSPSGLYTYPDVVAVCGDAEYEDAVVDSLLNPTVLMEVLSPSTEAYDRSGKFEMYRALESLREYVLIDQQRVHVEHYSRSEDGWDFREYSSPDQVLDLPSIGCQIALRRMYHKVRFADQEGA